MCWSILIKGHSVDCYSHLFCSLAQGAICSFPLFRIIVIVKHTGEFALVFLLSIIGAVSCASDTGVSENDSAHLLSTRLLALKSSVRGISNIKVTKYFGV